MKRRIGLAVLVVAVLIAASAIGLHANVLLRFSPALGGGIPSYARIGASEGRVWVPNDGEWAAIGFYRQTSCVPEEFNLLDFLDAPRAFGCELTVEGFEIWRNGPEAGDLGPIQAVSFGLGAVPIWFVKSDELQEAVADGVLTVAELGACASLRRGWASFFKETLHPFPVAQQTKLQIVARGTLEGGGAFFLQVEDHYAKSKHVLIRFE